MAQPTIPFPETAGSFLLPGPVGALELSVDLPEAAAARAGYAIVCHPHPLEGGTMHNKVVTMLARSLRELGLTTVRFNFRGVGASEGSYDNGRGETLDLLAVAQWAAAGAAGSRPVAGRIFVRRLDRPARRAPPAGHAGDLDRSAGRPAGIFPPCCHRPVPGW